MKTRFVVAALALVVVACDNKPLSPKVTRTPVPELPGLFRLEVATTWTTTKGQSREVRLIRYCYAP